MKKHYKLGILIGLVFVILIIIPSVRYSLLIYESNHAFVTSLYSKYCYKNGKENGNIKVKIYYKNLTECEKTFKNR